MSAAKVPINIVVIGHTDSGQSTNKGNLITRTRDTFQGFADMPPERSKANFKYAWVLHMMEGESRRGVTIDIDLGEFETPSYKVTIVNPPGQAQSLAKSMNTAFSQADAAVLIIGAGNGQFEELASPKSQTREDTQLAFANGVKQLIVGVERMESTAPAYSEARFEEVKRGVSASIRDIGYNPAAVAFVPFSSSQGDNVTRPSTQMPWFRGWSVERAEGDARGTSLIEAIDALLPAASRK